MAWDLRGALLKKEERESARLADFAFKHRARTFRLLAEELNIDSAATIALIACFDDTSLLAELRRQNPALTVNLHSLHECCSAKARTQLIKEIGDPAPCQLA